MGGPRNASLIRNFTGGPGTDSAASTAATTLPALTASGARRGFTGRERETAVYPATATPKVPGGKGQSKREMEKGRRDGGWEEEREGERSKQAKKEAFNF